MAEDRIDARETSWKQLVPWTELFKSFQIALDLNKMLLAAAGILVMSVAWFLLSLMFWVGSSPPPDWDQVDKKSPEKYIEIHRGRLEWNLMHEAIDLDKTDKPPRYGLEDIAETEEEYNFLTRPVLKEGDDPRPLDKWGAGFDKADVESAGFAGTGGEKVKKALEKLEAKLDKSPKKDREKKREYASYRQRLREYDLLGRVKPAGRLTTMPWSEDRGPNPYLLATNQTAIPWEPGHFWEWFTRDQAPVMIEPLIKFVRPIIYFLSPNNTFASRLYFLLSAVVMLLTWAVFGGAITRIAAVQYARGERIGMLEALRFSMRRLLDYILAPLFPLAFIFVLLVLMYVYGWVRLIPVVGDILVDGLLWPVMIVFGLIIAVALVGLVGWPLMAATISTEGTDSWEAVSRSYSYVYQRPWNYIWYSAVSIAYGGVVVFFVGFMASFSVFLAKWGVNNAGYFGRSPNFLFIYAPSSFGWRELLLEGAEEPNGGAVVQGRTERPLSEGAVGGVSRWNRLNVENYNEYVKNLNWWNRVGAAMVAFWLGLVFLLVLGFGYSFFWTSATIIYFLLRKSVDTNELDEVYQEEDDFDTSYVPPPVSQPTPAPSSGAAPARTLPLITPPPTVSAPPASAPPAAVPPPAAPPAPPATPPVETSAPPAAAPPPAAPEPPPASEPPPLLPPPAREEKGPDGPPPTA